MPSTVIPFVPPVIPAIAGVPALLAGTVSGAVASVVGDAPGLPTGATQQQWGIFNATSGSPVLIADSVARVSYARDYQVSDYPQESGSWMSYNKVQVPYQAKVSFLINSARFSFLNAIEAACASLALVSVQTPEITYPSANLTHYDYERTSKNGVSLILVTVWVEEIRITGTGQFSSSSAATPSPGTTSSPQSSNGSATQNNGSVQVAPTYVSLDTNTASSLAPPSGISPSTSLSTTITNSSNGSPFVDSSGLPQVPNAAAQLSTVQQGTVLSQGQAIGASSAVTWGDGISSAFTSFIP